VAQEVAKILRAFPSLLGLDTEDHFLPAVQFLERIGVTNIPRYEHSTALCNQRIPSKLLFFLRHEQQRLLPRFVQRLPPVLGYDLASNLEPKWAYLTKELKLSSNDVARFPAYFSYPLDTVPPIDVCNPALQSQDLSLLCGGVIAVFQRLSSPGRVT
jgi:hypothetical protein